MRRLNVLTWHTHGSYLYYLAHAPHEFHVLCKPGRPPGYGGRCGPFPFGPNVHDLPVDAARDRPFDVILFQEDQHWEGDRRHPVDDPGELLVHVTPFDAQMWDSGRTPTRVIEHGVAIPPGVHYRGEIERGLVVTNHLARRGRRMGADLFLRLRADDGVPLDLLGMGATELGGLGEIDHPRLPAFAANYRFLFSPVRYSSLSLGVIEAMLAGVPVVALATAEMATVIEHGVSGCAVTDARELAGLMETLLHDAGLARRLGEAGRRRARAFRHRPPCRRLGRRAAHRRRRDGGVMKVALISDHASPLAAPGSIDCGGRNVCVAHLARDCVLPELTVVPMRETSWP